MTKHEVILPELLNFLITQIEEVSQNEIRNYIYVNM